MEPPFQAWSRKRHIWPQQPGLQRCCFYRCRGGRSMSIPNRKGLIWSEALCLTHCSVSWTQIFPQSLESCLLCQYFFVPHHKNGHVKVSQCKGGVSCWLVDQDVVSHLGLWWSYLLLGPREVFDDDNARFSVITTIAKFFFIIFFLFFQDTFCGSSLLWRWRGTPLLLIY